MKIIPTPLRFDWDSGNKDKNLLKHHVTNDECEEIFFDPNKKIAKDTIHSTQETRHLLIGQTKKNRILFVIFTIKKSTVRIISARDLNKKERKLYYEKPS